MDPLTIGLITGGTNLLGSIFSSFTAKDNAQQQMQNQKALQLDSELFNRQERMAAQDFNAQQADINRGFQAVQIGQQREYQTQMSNTAYQRARADMMAAGLNPAAMFGSAGAASTPTGGAASGSSASVSGASVGTPTAPMPQTTHPAAQIGEAVSKGLGAAISAKTMEKMTDEIANLQAERGVIKAREKYIGAQAVTEAERPAQVRSQTTTEGERAKEVRENTRRLMNVGTLEALKIPAQRFSARQAEELEKLPDWAVQAATVGPFLGKAASDVISPFVSSGKAARQFFRDRTGFNW